MLQALRGADPTLNSEAITGKQSRHDRDNFQIHKCAIVTESV